jgi:hypothetical protein
MGLRPKDEREGSMKSMFFPFLWLYTAMALMVGANVCGWMNQIYLGHAMFLSGLVAAAVSLWMKERAA